MRAVDLMTRQVLTVRPQTPVREAAKLLSGNGFTALPVVDETGALVGVVTEADLIRDRVPADARSLITGHDPAEPRCHTAVGDVMTAPVVTVNAGTDVTELVKLLLRQHLRSVPVVDGEQLVGIVTRADIVRCLARPDEEIATDIRCRLAICSEPGRWDVEVRQGRVTLHDSRDDPVHAHVAKIVALGIRGVEWVEVVPATAEQTSRSATEPGAASPGHVSAETRPVTRR